MVATCQMVFRVRRQAYGALHAGVPVTAQAPFSHQKADVGSSTAAMCTVFRMVGDSAMLRQSEIYVSATLFIGATALVLLGAFGVFDKDSDDLQDTTEPSVATSILVTSDLPGTQMRTDSLEPEVWQQPIPSYVVKSASPAVLISQPGDAPLSAGAPVHMGDCRYWNVLRPVNDSHDSFLIGGWVKECDGVMGPVVQPRPEETIEEVYLRLENAVAQLGQLQQKLDATIR